MIPLAATIKLENDANLHFKDAEGEHVNASPLPGDPKGEPLQGFHRLLNCAGTFQIMHDSNYGTFKANNGSEFTTDILDIDFNP